MKVETKIFAISLFAGLVLRFFMIIQRDFWFDEAFTFYIANLPLKTMFQAILTDNNPPLYYLIIHFLLKISTSYIFIRLPSLIFNLAAIFVFFVFLKKYFNSKVASITGSLMAVSPLSIYIGTEARLHSLAMLFVVTGISLFFLLLKKADIKTILFFILISILGLYTQYYFALLFVPMSSIVIFKRSALTVKRWLLIVLLVSLTAVPWIYLSTFTTHSGCSCPNTIFTLPAVLVSPVLVGLGPTTLREFTSLPNPLLIFFSLSATVIIFLYIRGVFRNWLLSIVYLIPFLILSLLGLFLPIFSPKAFSIFSPLYLTFIALAINTYRRKGWMLSLVIILLTFISAIQIINPFFNGERVKLIAQAITQKPKLPVLHTSVVTFYSLNYYLRDGRRNFLITQNPLSPETVEFIGGKKQNIDPKSNEFWLINTSKWVDTKEYDFVLRDLSKGFKIQQVVQIDKVTVNLLTKK